MNKQTEKFLEYIEDINRIVRESEEGSQKRSDLLLIILELAYMDGFQKADELYENND